MLSPYRDRFSALSGLLSLSCGRLKDSMGQGTRPNNGLKRRVDNERPLKRALRNCSRRVWGVRTWYDGVDAVRLGDGGR